MGTLQAPMTARTGKVTDTEPLVRGALTMALSVAQLLAPKASDIQYTAKDHLIIATIFRTDSYKFTHPFMFRELNKRKGRKKVVGMSSYGEARVPQDVKVTVFGGQMGLQKIFYRPITMDDVNAAEAFAMAHFGRPLFDRAAWEKVVNVYGGWIPCIVRAVPDGTVIRGGDPIYSVTVLDEDLFWMSSGIETCLLRAYWYPTTIASLDRDTKLEIIRFYELSGVDPAGAGFALHDFGGRGVTCGEQAEVGGAAHGVSFLGSDTIEGILALNFYYDSPMSMFSVFATEHSVECSFGLDVEGEADYIRAMLAHALPGTIVSIVIDGKDMKRCAKMLCAPAAEGGFREAIIASQAKVVFRPDSGDMMEIVPWLLRLQDEAFGHVVNAKGYRKINHVGIIYGDGVDRLNMLTLLGNILAMGYTADSVVFGSGGALLQKVNRDTLKFAQKGALLIFEDGTTLGIAKDPVTDHGKKSKEGLLTLLRHRDTGELKIARLEQGFDETVYEDLHVLMYHTGRFFNKTNLDEVRTRAA
jgi:nicotinamide phosphoribosyltransferase